MDEGAHNTSPREVITEAHVSREKGSWITQRCICVKATCKSWTVRQAAVRVYRHKSIQFVATSEGKSTVAEHSKSAGSQGAADGRRPSPTCWQKLANGASFRARMFSCKRKVCSSPRLQKGKVAMVRLLIASRSIYLASNPALKHLRRRTRNPKLFECPSSPWIFPH